MPRSEVQVNAGCNDSAAKLWHVVLTQFSYRGSHMMQREVDPLNPHRLDFRFEVFELVCAPSVLAQTNQRFDWVILIDKDLPAAYRKRLLEAVGHRARTYVHEFSPSEDITGTAWLARYAPADTRRFLTTLLDDDDTLPVNFVDAVQSEVDERLAKLPCLMTFGYKSSLEWDLICSSRAPFGYQYPWHRGNWVRSAGFSLLSGREQDVSVFAIPHGKGDVWFSVATAKAFAHKFADRISPEARANIEAAVSLSKQQGVELFVELSGKTGPVVMTNHYYNDVVFRLLEPKSERSPVRGRESFPNTVVEVEGLRRSSKFFEKRWRMYTRIFKQTGRLRPYGAEKLGRFRLAIWGAWRFMSL